jgi:hypothetical protein
MARWRGFPVAGVRATRTLQRIFPRLEGLD